MKEKTELLLTDGGTEWGPMRINAGCSLCRSQVYFPFSRQPWEKRWTPPPTPMIQFSHEGALAIGLGAAGTFTGQGRKTGEEHCSHPCPKSHRHISPAPPHHPCQARPWGGERAHAWQPPAGSGCRLGLQGAGAGPADMKTDWQTC